MPFVLLLCSCGRSTRTTPFESQRFSPLTQINEQTVSRLGLAWSRELPTTRGLEATPIVKDGVIFFTGAWSVVYAMDARTGETRWTFDPKVPRDRAMFLCCDAVNRGVALDHGKVYVGTLDSRLIALDERTGAPVWDVSTVAGAANENAYSITAAPLVAKGIVIIGNAGSEYGVRGYISAFDAKTGKLIWRFYVVPGDPSKGFESKAMETAAKTWHGEWWKTGGGGSPWEGMVYDPALDLAYFGTGNPTSWYRAQRGGGDNLYTGSILAVRASNGELVWHFQTMPGDNYDYDATQPLVQADLEIRGRLRRVILQANKNGFFYVLDRATGEFISGAPFVSGITWASGLDAKTGRPIEPHPVGFDASMVSPSTQGAHNWNPIAFSPATGLVYLAAMIGTQFIAAPDPNWKYNPNSNNTGSEDSYDGPLNSKFSSMPAPRGELLAWDPVRQKAAWNVGYPVVEDGGVLATAGDLVFQGRADGVLAAMHAAGGREFWTFDAGTGIMAPPVTYMVNGVQYVSVLAGWGGPSGSFNSPLAGKVKPGYGRILTFKLDGTAKLEARPYGHTALPEPVTGFVNSPESVREGRLLYGRWCAKCHGWNAIAGPMTDLRYSSKETLASMEDIVLRGTLVSAGMPSFGKLLNDEQVGAIRAFIVSRR
jgi:quinohemoprotein ethanol dehydrogenase